MKTHDYTIQCGIEREVNGEWVETAYTVEFDYTGGREATYYDPEESDDVDIVSIAGPDGAQYEPTDKEMYDILEQCFDHAKRDLRGD